jgi:ribosomal protein S27AE
MMPEKRRTERRKANQVPPREKRGHAPDRRRCPACGSSVRTLHESLLGGSVTRRYCSKCQWKEDSRQMDVEHVRALLGFETQIFGTAKKPMLELSPELLKAAGWSLKDTLELKPLYTPGAEKSLSFVLKKI